MSFAVGSLVKARGREWLAICETVFCWPEASLKDGMASEDPLEMEPMGEEKTTDHTDDTESRSGIPARPDLATPKSPTKAGQPGMADLPRAPHAFDTITSRDAKNYAEYGLRKDA